MFKNIIFTLLFCVTSFFIFSSNCLAMGGAFERVGKTIGKVIDKTVSEKELNNGIANNFAQASDGITTASRSIFGKVKKFGNYGKYIAALICLYYAYHGVKEIAESAKSLAPVGADMNPIDIVLYPIRLLLMPFKAVGAIKSLLLSGGFAVSTIALHKFSK